MTRTIQSSLALEDAKPKRAKKKATGPVALSAPAGLRWLQVDPCSLMEPKSAKTKRPRMGLAWWEGTRLMACGTLWEDQTAPENRWRVRVWHNDQAEAITHSFASDFHAIRACLWQIPGEEPGSFRVRACIREKGFGANPRSLSDQSECRGFIRALANHAGCEWVLDVSPGQWKKAAGAFYNAPFPSKSAPGKIHGLELVRRHFNVRLGDEDADASDAIMQGVGAMLLGLLPEEGE